MNKKILFLFVLQLFWPCDFTSQNSLNNVFEAKSDFVPEIKNSEKFDEIPSIIEYQKPPINHTYSINSLPFQPAYTIQPIFPATLKNEPKKRLYFSFLKLGYSPFYSMPFGQIRLANGYSRNYHLSAEYQHLSSNSNFSPYPVTSFSDNLFSLNGKKFYKKHTLNGRFLYQRNVLYYYGYNTAYNTISEDRINFLRQRYHVFEPMLNLKSHYTDTSKINHDLGLGYYHYANAYGEYENRLNVNAFTDQYLHGEHFTAQANILFFNNRNVTDTNNHLMIMLNPAFHANGKQWKAHLGFRGTLVSALSTNENKFYFHPDIHIEYDVADALLIPFANIQGRVERNTIRSLTTENPFADTALVCKNTNHKAQFTAGLKGKLSSHTNYLASVSYSISEHLPYFFTSYSTSLFLDNYYTVRYVSTKVLQVHGELRFQWLEKWKVNLYGNYFHYKPDSSMKPFHKPEYDLGGHVQYYLGEKILAGINLNFVGKRWAKGRDQNGNITNQRIKEITDFNLELEYRYTRFLSFFLRLNNLTNSRYAVWDKYPTYRFFGMLGLTFIPF